MGNGNAVNINGTVTTPETPVPYLQHALLSFSPSTTLFSDGFKNSTQPWMFLSPATNLGLVAELSSQDWASQLKSLGATPDEPIWIAADAHFNQLSVADGQGIRARLQKPDVLYVGRRTSAVVSINTFTFSNNTAGRTRVKVNPAKFLYSGQDPAGALADVTVISDGVLTVTELAEDLVAQLNADTEFAAVFLASNVAGVVSITSLQPGYPLVVEYRVTNPGPSVVLAVTTANVANAYRDDLIEMQEAFETGSDLDPPMRRAYWVSDLQGDDVVNAEGMAWVEAEGLKNPIYDYQFVAWSTSGNKPIKIGANFVGNFDAASTHSAAAIAKQANGGEGWHRSGVHDHDRLEFVAAALLGRTIAYLPGATSFTSKVLNGATVASKMSGRDYANSETLSLSRTFNWYSAEGPQGSEKWGYLADGSYMDRVWLADFSVYICKLRLQQWMTLKNIVAYSNDDIAAAAGILSNALAQLPAINQDTINVTFLTREQVPPNFIAGRVYNFYITFAQSFGVINRLGTLDDKLQIFISDGG